MAIKVRNAQFRKDFFAFKIHVSFIVKIIFTLVTLGCILAGLSIIRGNFWELGIAIVGISFELFSILYMLLEIRNNIFEIRDKMANKE